MRMPLKQVTVIASRYSNSEIERSIESSIAPAAIDRGWLLKSDLLLLARWKSPRIVGQVDQNDDDFIREVTAIAFSTKNERIQIEVLTLLKGVGWPMASVILHFCTKDRYPILDFRALWSLGREVPKVYDFEFWQQYTLTCRELADRAGVSMRTLDRALWQYSKENQKPHT